MMIIKVLTSQVEKAIIRKKYKKKVIISLLLNKINIYEIK